MRTIAAFSSSILTALLYVNGAFYPFMMLAGVQLAVSVVGGVIVWHVERRTRAAAEPVTATTLPVVEAERQSAPVLETAAK